MRLFYPLSFFGIFSYPKNMVSLDPDLHSPSDGSLNNLFRAFGSVLGYIGAEKRLRLRLRSHSSIFSGFNAFCLVSPSVPHLSWPFYIPWGARCTRRSWRQWTPFSIMVCWRGLTRVVCWEHPFFQRWNGCIPCTAMANNLPTQSLFATVCGLVYYVPQCPGPDTIIPRPGLWERIVDKNIRTLMYTQTLSVKFQRQRPIILLCVIQLSPREHGWK